MNKLKQVSKIASLLMILIVVFSTVSIPALAGANITESELVTPAIEKAEAAMNITDWYNPNDDLLFENGVVVFPSDSNEETRIISKNAAFADSHFEELLQTEITFNLTSMPEGKEFILALGLESIESLYGEEGNVELHIKKNGSLVASLVEYTADGENVLVAERNSGIALNRTATVGVTVFADGTLKVIINGSVFCNVKATALPEGRVGFMQTGECTAAVQNFKFKSYSYDTPENPNIFEDFESGTINVNALTSSMYNATRNPNGIVVEELEDGNKVLMFKNVLVGYFGTTYSYSNFELEFDIPYILRSDVYDEYGAKRYGINGEIGISFGDIAADGSGELYTQSTDLVLLTGGGGISGYLRGKWSASFGKEDFFKPDTNEGYSVKLRLVDGTFTAYVKGLKDTQWKEMATHTYSNTKAGPIKIWSTRDTNFAIDNFKVTNLDMDANLIEVDYKSGIITQADFEYTPQEMVFKPKEKTDAKKGFNWAWILIGSVALSVLIIGAGVLGYILPKRKAQKKGQVPNEE